MSKFSEEIERELFPEDIRVSGLARRGTVITKQIKRIALIDQKLSYIRDGLVAIGCYPGDGISIEQDLKDSKRVALELYEQLRIEE